MAKRTAQKSSPSGVESLLVSDSFVYEISLYKIFKDRVELAGSQLYSSPEKIKLKKETIYKRTKEYTLMKCIEWLAAPREFIIENNLNMIIPCQKLRKTRKKA